MGTGTTAVASKELGRNWIGFDLNQEYVDLSNKRTV
jgi:site-specific DNA-methyltransferase (adenine-specific)